MQVKGFFSVLCYVSICYTVKKFQNHLYATEGDITLFTNCYILQGPANKNVDYLSMQCFFPNMNLSGAM